AISADSMLRTTCFACWSLVVSTWISLTSPSGVTTTRAESTPVRLVIRFSARFTPHGSGAWGGVNGIASRFSAPSGLEGVTLSVPPSPPGFAPRPWRGTAHGQPPRARLPSPGPAPARTPPPPRSPSPAPRRSPGSGPCPRRWPAPCPLRPRPPPPACAPAPARTPRPRRAGLLVEIGGARPERRASQRGGVGERPARRVPARAAVPRLAVRREPDLLQDGFHRFRLWPVPVLGDRERLGDLHPARHRFLHHRGARPRRLRRPHDLAPPEQLVPRTQQRMVEAPLARQDVHEAQVQTIH